MKEWKVSSVSIEEAIGGKSITQTDVEVNCAAIVSMPRDNSIMFVMTQRFNCEACELIGKYKKFFDYYRTVNRKIFFGNCLKESCSCSIKCKTIFCESDKSYISM